MTKQQYYISIPTNALDDVMEEMGAEVAGGCRRSSEYIMTGASEDSLRRDISEKLAEHIDMRRLDDYKE